jgi:hypothetical protein
MWYNNNVIRKREIKMKEKNIKELQEKIDQLENIIFNLDLIDHWTKKDTELFEKYNKELRQLKELVINELIR